MHASSGRVAQSDPAASSFIFVRFVLIQKNQKIKSNRFPSRLCQMNDFLRKAWKINDISFPEFYP